MKSSMFKILSVVAIMSAISFSDVLEDASNTIDAFTSSSIYHSLKIHTSKATSNSAEINWWEDWEIDNHVRRYEIMWGTEDGVYTDTINLNPYEDSVVNNTVLTGLQPGTKYYAFIYRDYNGHLYNRDFVFTTPPLDPIPPVPEDDPGYIDPSHVAFPKQPLSKNAFREIANVKVSTLSGREVSTFPYISRNNTTTMITRSKLVPGLYIATFMSKKKSALSSVRFLIN